MKRFLKIKSEDYVLGRMIGQIEAINHITGEIYKEHTEKCIINNKIVGGIHKQGYQFSSELSENKEKLINAIISQQEEVVIISRILKRINRLMSLLIYMEQADLFIHKRRHDNDLAELIDPTGGPVEKFRKEADQIKMLVESFEILKVELEKQKQYIKAFTLDPGSLEEDFFMQSEKYISQISESEMTNMSHLKRFALGLEEDIRKHFHPKVKGPTESEKVALEIINEFKKIRMGRMIWEPSLHRFIIVITKRNLNSKKLDMLISFFIFFLLSRMKRFKESEYYSTVRRTILIYNLPSKMDWNKRYILAGSTLLANLRILDFQKEELNGLEGEEMDMIRKYYGTVREIFEEEFTFINMLVEMYHQKLPKDGEMEWLKKGAKLMKLVYQFDEELRKCGFNELKSGDIRNRLTKYYPGELDSLEYLTNNWTKIIPISLRKA